MASTTANDYITKLAKYLKQPGTPPDLTVKFGDKVYKIHKVLACAQSEWFSKAVNGAFKEGQTGVITLEDDEHFGAAIECMMVFFYNAQYSTGAGLADVLQVLRSASYNITADWVKLGTLVYDYMSTDLPSHVKMRESVVYPINYHRLNMMAQEVRNFLKSHPLAAVDVLFKEQIRSNESAAQNLFKCPDCIYAHAAAQNCTFLSKSNVPNLGACCPKCFRRLSDQPTGAKPTKMTLNIRCGGCWGMHTG